MSITDKAWKTCGLIKTATVIYIWQDYWGVVAQLAEHSPSESWVQWPVAVTLCPLARHFSPTAFD